MPALEPNRGRPLPTYPTSWQRTPSPSPSWQLIHEFDQLFNSPLPLPPPSKESTPYFTPTLTPTLIPTLTESAFFRSVSTDQGREAAADVLDVGGDGANLRKPSSGLTAIPVTAFPGTFWADIS